MCVYLCVTERIGETESERVRERERKRDSTKLQAIPKKLAEVISGVGIAVEVNIFL